MVGRNAAERARSSLGSFASISAAARHHVHGPTFTEFAVSGGAARSKRTAWGGYGDAEQADQHNEQELLALYEKLRNREESLREVTGKKKTRMTELEERAQMQFAKSKELAESTAERADRRAKEASTNGEAERQRALAEQLTQEKNTLQEELTTIGDEANGKIEAANERIRSLRKERDDALRDQEQAMADNRQLCLSVQELNSEKAKLAEQKESLISIVEDLHQACTTAGLSLHERTSMDTIRNLKF